VNDVPLRRCPNCGQGVPEGVTLCPNCGAAVPPTPTLRGAPPEPERLMTKHRWLDVTLGLLTVVGAFMLFGVGVLVALLIYFVVKKSYPVYARGIGYGLAFIGILLFGALAWCVGCIAVSNVRP
jgi:hypothetical protein